MRTIAIACLLLCVGCSGEMITAPGPAPADDDDGSDDGGDEGASARALFDDLAEQQLIECGACHAGANLDDTATGPDFLGQGADTSYDTILDYRSYQDGSPLIGDSPENSKLYVYGAHAGPALSSTLAAKVASWIVAEAGGDPGEDPVDPGTQAPATLVDALTRFTSCMTFTDFQTAQFAAIADQNTAEGQCYACHASGTGGAFLAEDDIEFYTNQRNMPYVLKFAIGTVNEDGSFKDLVVSGRYEDKQADNGHPNYILEPARAQSIQQFFDLTYVRYQASIQNNTPCTPDTPVVTPPP